MRTPILSAIVLAALIAPASAATYPVSGRWGQSPGDKPGAIDCGTSKRVIGFNGNTRTDSGGGVRAYQNRSVTGGPSQYSIVDIFTTGQISSGHVSYTLRLIDGDHIEMQTQNGTLKLQRCK
jgi:hypothetical protein